MDFELSEEVQQIRDPIARYVDDQLVPRAAEIDEAHAFPRDAFAEIGALGFFRMLYPENSGGLGLGMVSKFGAAPDIAGGFVRILPVKRWDCRRHSGAPLVSFVGYIRDEIEWSGDARKIFNSSTNIERGFCGKCGSPVLSFIEEMPAVKFVKAGSLDDSSWLKIDSNFYSSSAHSWSPIDEDILSFTHNPDKL